MKQYYISSQASDACYRLMVQGVVDCAIYMLDCAGNVATWNVGAQRLKGYSAQEIIGQHFSCFYLEHDRAAGLPARVLSEALTSRKLEGRGVRVRKDGTKFAVNFVVEPIFDDEGHHIGFAKITRDITETEEFAQSLIEANKKLSKFTSIVAHDLRAPLKRIESFIEVLREDCSNLVDSHFKQIIDRICVNTTRMRQMIDSLHEYTKLANYKPDGRIANLQQTLFEVTDSLYGELRACTLTHNIDKHTLVKVDKFLLQRVLLNIISNCIKYRNNHPPIIQINAQAGRDGMIRVEITDNGIGIEPKFAEKVFDMFTRLHCDDEYEGTGIGLSICQKIIQDHGGNIFIDTRYRAGTRIVFTLPEANTESSHTKGAIL